MKQLSVQPELHERHLTVSSEETSAIGGKCLDVFNGLLLASRIEAPFDGGCISFAGGETTPIFAALSKAAHTQLVVSARWGREGVDPMHAASLEGSHQNGLPCLGQ